MLKSSYDTNVTHLFKYRVAEALFYRVGINKR